MRTSRLAVVLLFLSTCALGCASVSGGRAGLPERWRTMASAGGKPSPVESGPPGRSVTAELEEPEPRSRAEGRVSGRVVDHRGRPVPNAEVRLADGSRRAGKDLRDTTDDAGGFTIKGLRPGGTYTLIAEGDDGKGQVSGRAKVTAPSTSVRIKLAGEDHVSERDATPEASPAPRVGRVSDRDDADESVEEEAAAIRKPAPRVNPSDLPPAVEAEAINDRETSLASATPKKSVRAPWRRGGTGDPAVEMADSTNALTRSSRSIETSTPKAAPDEDGPNPLPPAKERVIDKPPDTAIPVEPAPTPTPTAAPKPPESTKPPEPTPTPEPAPAPAPATNAPPTPPPAAEPPAIPATPAENSPQSKPAEPAPVASPTGPTPGPTPGDPGPPADSPPGGSPPATNPPGQNPPADSVAIAAEVAPRQKPTWRELTEQHEASKVASTIPISTRRRSSSEVAADSNSAGRSRSSGGFAGLLSGRARAGTRDGEATDRDPKFTPASCQFDAKRQRIVDFRLPDLEGKTVRFQDMDSDYVLIDFWGTWCKPCRDSVPHLVELQTRYGPKTLRVVGIATEHGPSRTENAKTVDTISKSLGINYPVLLSEADGKACPLQEALHVQAYPTMVLVDRSGIILWRGTGAELPTLARLDRVIASRADSAVVRR